jgi:hypothetical protein
MKKNIKEYIKKLNTEREKELKKNSGIKFNIAGITSPSLLVYINGVLYRVVSSTVLRKELGLKPDTLLKRRKQNTYKEGIHYFKIGTDYYYNFDLLYD